MMGMGEPLANFDAVVPALKLMRDDLGFGLASRRVTVSTAGLVPGIRRLRESVDVALAVSLPIAWLRRREASSGAIEAASATVGLLDWNETRKVPGSSASGSRSPSHAHA